MTSGRESDPGGPRTPVDTPTGTDADELERAEALAEIDEATLPHELPRNNVGRILIRLAFSIGFLALLIWQLPDVSIGDIFPEPTAAALAWTVAAVVVHVVAYLLQTLRWAEVSDTLGVHLPFRRLFSHLITGEFVSNALPTSFGGDIVRVVRQGNDAGDFADAFASTAIERLTGWLVLPLLCFTGMLLVSDYRDLGSRTVAALAICGVTLVALLSILWIAGHEQGAGRFLGSGGWRRYLGAVHLGIVAFRHQPGRVTRVLGAGVGFQVMQCISVWACAKAFGLPEVTFLAALTFFPPTAIVQNFPLALGGLGVREAAFVFFFGALGVSNSDAIGLGLLIYIVFVVSSLAGAPSFLSGGFTGTGLRARDPGAT